MLKQDWIHIAEDMGQWRVLNAFNGIGFHKRKVNEVMSIRIATVHEKCWALQCHYEILGAFAKLRKATVNCAMSVC